MLAVNSLRKKRLATRTSIDFLGTQSSYETNFRLVVLSLRRQRIDKWLRENNKDKAGKSYKTNANVSPVLGVSGQGVINAVAKNPAIYRSKKN